MKINILRLSGTVIFGALITSLASPCIAFSASDLPSAAEFSPTMEFTKNFVRYDGSRLLKREDLKNVVTLIKKKDDIDSKETIMELVKMLDYLFYKKIAALSEREKDVFINNVDNVSKLKNKITSFAESVNKETFCSKIPLPSFSSAGFEYTKPFPRALLFENQTIIVLPNMEEKFCASKIKPTTPKVCEYARYPDSITNCKNWKFKDVRDCKIGFASVADNVKKLLEKDENLVALACVSGPFVFDNVFDLANLNMDRFEDTLTSRLLARTGWIEFVPRQGDIKCFVDEMYETYDSDTERCARKIAAREPIYRLPEKTTPVEFKYSDTMIDGIWRLNNEGKETNIYIEIASKQGKIEGKIKLGVLNKQKTGAKNKNSKKKDEETEVDLTKTLNWKREANWDQPCAVQGDFNRMSGELLLDIYSIVNGECRGFAVQGKLIDGKIVNYPEAEDFHQFFKKIGENSIDEFAKQETVATPVTTDTPRVYKTRPGETICPFEAHKIMSPAAKELSKGNKYDPGYFILCKLPNSESLEAHIGNEKLAMKFRKDNESRRYPSGVFAFKLKKHKSGIQEVLEYRWLEIDGEVVK